MILLVQLWFNSTKKNYFYELFGHEGSNSDSLMVKKINGEDRLQMNGQKSFYLVSIMFLRGLRKYLEK